MRLAVSETSRTDWEQALQSNKALWNELTTIHAQGEVYQMTAFRQGAKQLDPLIRSEVGEVAGKSLLHLQCHFGMDTLMWARLGARVTGVDFANEAIALARRLSDEIGVPATFIETDLYRLPQVLDGAFDILYTSWGVLNWLPDLTSWGQLIARYLRAGGFFYIAEGHPFMRVFYDEDDAASLRVHYSYFHQAQPLYFPPSRDYADETQQLTHPEYAWHHSVGDILSALIDAGLRIVFFHEHRVLPWKAFPFLVEDGQGYWQLPPEFPPFPLSFSLKATKE
jgi:SAM-dependent methyltransferase